MNQTDVVLGLSELNEGDVERSLDEIDRPQHKIPSKRRSVSYCLVTRDRHYPPKYVLGLAYKLRTGKKLEGLQGGAPTNGPLQAMGYTVIPHKCRNARLNVEY